MSVPARPGGFPRPQWSKDAQAGPHEWSRRRGWRFWICNHCYAPKSLHPRKEWVVARPLTDNYYLSADAPHFQEGW